MIHLIPKNGARVRNPKGGKVLDAAGIKMERLDSFWYKRLAAGEVMEAPAEKAAKKSENSDKEKSK